MTAEGQAWRSRPRLLLVALVISVSAGFFSSFFLNAVVGSDLFGERLMTPIPMNTTDEFGQETLSAKEKAVHSEGALTSPPSAPPRRHLSSSPLRVSSLGLRRQELGKSKLAAEGMYGKYAYEEQFLYCPNLEVLFIWFDMRLFPHRWM